MLDQEEPNNTLEKEKQRGVCLISRIPPGLQVNKIRELLQPYGIERVYLAPAGQQNLIKTKKTTFKKRRNYQQGWVEFTDFKAAKMTALSLNGTPMIHQKRSQFSDDLWQIKYLKNFKWDDLNEKFNYDRRVHQEKVKLEMQQAKKIHDFYQEKVEEQKNRKKVKVQDQNTK